MSCQRCKSNRILGVTGKSSDCNSITIAGKTVSDQTYVPRSPIGGGDYIRFKVCLDCGQVQGTFPAPELTFEVYGRGGRSELTESEILDGSSNEDPE